jgi:hypothetical protein
MMTVEDFIAKVPAGYDWLLRSDGENKVFCHLYRENTQRPGEFTVSIMYRAPTARAALSLCLQELGL